MKTKHTKGEWGIRFKRRIGYNASHTIIYADKEGIAENICEFDGQNKQIEANAKLIAAAPELLKALKFLTNVANKDKPYVYDFTKDELKAHRMAIKAIKKATE